MPQMSSMDWLILSIFFLTMYFLGLLMIYFFVNFENKFYKNFIKHNFEVIW